MEKVKKAFKLWQKAVKNGTATPRDALLLLESLEVISLGNFPDADERVFWLKVIDETRKPDYLQALQTPENRNRWVEVVLGLIRHTNYSLLDLVEQRVAAHPGDVLFRDYSDMNSIVWSYEQVLHHIREIAALFYAMESQPRVALFTENCFEGAATDLACLTHGIFVSPLSPHLTLQELKHIFNELSFNIILTDAPARLKTLTKLNDSVEMPFRIISLRPGLETTDLDGFLPALCKRLSIKEVNNILGKTTPPPINQVITTMFTSGSTGIPKGVSFSIYNIVSKRFARAAALPEIGHQVFLCYLPLFHTFGRYLEMTGALFWDGTYVFAGNTSAETLFALMPEVAPTGLISVPLRWQELYDRCMELSALDDGLDKIKRNVQALSGGKLSWGLSAAGYLDPGVFRFFNRHGINLCSGFGMTEATGGITMTPPGKYIDDTVGIPLPGVYTRLAENGELEIRGHYIARYLEDAGPGDEIPYPISPDQDWWLSTGDVFTVASDGYYKIVDRVKDIYKNNRGQTVAPQVIEKKFQHVPGIRRVFLAGDHRPYNVLLIVPDREDPLVNSFDEENLLEYYQQIVAQANQDVAPYERVINFTLIDRDFSKEKGEITPKGSLNRKTIAHHFGKEIEALYTSRYVTLQTPDVLCQIPKWLIRDLGILEDDIVFKENRLVNRRTQLSLIIRKLDDGMLQIGDLKYLFEDTTIDLGLFVRQPRLWFGNSAMIRFFPVREGWDSVTGPPTDRIYFADFRHKQYLCEGAMKRIRNPLLTRVSELLCAAAFGNATTAYSALEELGSAFESMEPRMADVVRLRIEALAFHPNKEIRVLAYRIILLQAPSPDKIPYMPAFIQSGKSFLDQESIREIINSNFGKHRLDALKKRLYYYRNHLTWPSRKNTRRQFAGILDLLQKFAMIHLDYYGPVRAELARWILHKEDPWLSDYANQLFITLRNHYEEQMTELATPLSAESWEKKVVFEYGISIQEKERILEVLRTNTFLNESISLIYNVPGFSPVDIPDQGIWILRMLGFKEFNHYRLSINTISGNHFDLHMVLSFTNKFTPDPHLFYWLASLAGFPGGPAVTPLLGSSKPDRGVLSTQYIGGLTAWEKIRELSEIHQSSGVVEDHIWRKIFVQAFSVIFRAWHQSGYQIIPGTIAPTNVVIPELDFKEKAVILSLTGWSAYKHPLSLVGPMLRDFYERTVALYPWCQTQLKIRWIFDACIEALGKQEAGKFFHQLMEILEKRLISCVDGKTLKWHLGNYLEEIYPLTYLPLDLYNAIDQYKEWIRMNPMTKAEAKEQTLFELMELYRLGSYADLIRYCFYRHTYFAEFNHETLNAFDHLIEKLKQDPRVLPIQLIELSQLQTEIKDSEDQDVFNRMVFPSLPVHQKIGFLKTRDEHLEEVVVQFTIQDTKGKQFLLREPIEPREIGLLYQLFYRENYPKEPVENDRQLVLIDDHDRVVGGLTWRSLDKKMVLLDGIVINHLLQDRGLGSGVMKHFFAAMEARGVQVIKAHFLLGNVFMKNYFRVDPQWGALVKRL
jgi:long-chain acyl-CoA synthetase